MNVLLMYFDRDAHSYPSITTKKNKSQGSVKHGSSITPWELKQNRISSWHEPIVGSRIAEENECIKGTRKPFAII